MLHGQRIFADAVVGAGDGALDGGANIRLGCQFLFGALGGRVEHQADQLTIQAARLIRIDAAQHGLHEAGDTRRFFRLDACSFRRRHRAVALGAQAFPGQYGLHEDRQTGAQQQRSGRQRPGMPAREGEHALWARHLYARWRAPIEQGTEIGI